MKNMKSKSGLISAQAGSLGESQKGSAALIMILALSILVLIPVAMQVSSTSRSQSQFQLASSQADNAARAGLVDAIAWFRRQPGQPVHQTGGQTFPDQAFAPQANSNPLLNDTLDPTVGIVKEYALSDTSELWVRYEVRKQSDTASNAVDVHAVHDITDKRMENHSAGDGLAWYIESSGYVYAKRDPAKAFNEAPNVVKAHARASTEIMRVSVQLPALAALSVNDVNTVTFKGSPKIRGGSSVGLAYHDGVPLAALAPSTVSGSPAFDEIASAIDPKNIFGMSPRELKVLADISVSTFSEMPYSYTGHKTYPDMALVFIDGNAKFDSGRQLIGGGILFVNGDLSITAGSLCNFSGIIYVDGNLSVSPGSVISGAVVVKGSVYMDGTQAAEINYDESIVNSVRNQLAQYRENRSTYYNFSGAKLTQ